MTFLDRIKETSTSTGTGTFTLSGAVLGYKVFTNGTYKYCIVNDSESEWEVGEGTVASGVLTRTTIEASSNGGAAVSFSAGTKYVFNTVSAAYVNSLVPYTGATAAVNLGAYGLTSDYLQLSTTPTASGAVGRMLWNDQIGSTETTLKGGSVVLKNGVDLVARVVNKVTPAATLTKATYKAVRVSGAQGQRLAIAYAQANNDNNSADTIGLVCETIAANQEGFIITVGQLTGINTTGSLQGETWADGDVLYLSPTTAGNLTNIKPNGSTGHIVVIGYVEYAHAINGSIYVKIMNGWELSELHDTYINAVANNDVLVYESSSTLWKNKSIATILGYTPQAAITLTTTGTSGAATFASNTLNIPQYQGALTLTTTGTSGAATLVGNTLNIPQYAAGISGSGTAGQVTYWSGTSAVTGSSNLFWDNTNGRLGIGTSSPQYKLDVTNNVDSGTEALRVTNTNTGGSATAGIAIQSSGAYGALFATSTTYSSLPILGPSTIGFYVNKTFSIAINDASSNFRIITGSTLTERLRLFNGGNLLLQNGGTFTDGGQRLQVIGSMRVGSTAASAMYWDDTNNRLGIGTSSPGSPLDINLGAGDLTRTVSIRNSSSTGYSSVTLYDNRNNSAYVGQWGLYGSGVASPNTSNMYFYNTAGGSIGFYTGTGTASNDLKFLMRTNGNTSLQNGGTFTDNGYRLEVDGTGATNGCLKTTGKVRMSSLPTSATGLSAGDLWNNSGVINIV